jgi:hypothetical protein
MQKKLIGVKLVFASVMAIAVAGQASHRGAQANDCEVTQTSAYRGDVDAQYALGMMYKQGQGCPYDPVMSFFWLDMAARAGHPAAFSPSDEISEILSSKTIFRISKAVDELRACQRAQRFCEPVAQLQTEFFMESLFRL